MNVLLDTHALVWALTNDASLSRRAASIVADERNNILVSAASAWEIATKVRLGKFREAEVLERRFVEVVVQLSGYTLLPISAETALRAGRLPSDHRDPFDRLIAAQALADDIPVISMDAKLDSFGVRRIW